MKLFKQFNRVALLFNLMFIACMAVRFLWVDAQGTWVSILIVGGWLISFPCNLLLASWMILQLLRKQSNPMQAITILNLLVLVFQIFYFIVL